jgi:hypothetical protein
VRKYLWGDAELAARALDEARRWQAARAAVVRPGPAADAALLPLLAPRLCELVRTYLDGVAGPLPEGGEVPGTHPASGTELARELAGLALEQVDWRALAREALDYLRDGD